MPEHKRDSLKDPYFAHGPDVVTTEYTGFSVGNDFNREVVPPGKDPAWPEGVIGIRVDDDFWVVGALPYAEYLDVPLAEVVEQFWPGFTSVSLKPDSRS